MSTTKLEQKFQKVFEFCVCQCMCVYVCLLIHVNVLVRSYGLCCIENKQNEKESENARVIVKKSHCYDQIFI